MENKPNLVKQLEKKYHKIYEITDFKDLLYKTYEQHKNQIAFQVKKDGKIVDISYREYKEDIENLATAFVEMGMENKRICVIGKNRYEWAVSYMAAAIVGIVVPLDKELKIEEILQFNRVADTAIVLGDAKYMEQLLEHKNELHCSDLTLVSFDETEELGESVKSFSDLLNQGKALLEEGDERFKEIQIDPDEMHILLFTSGTTGSSKAVCLSQRNICSNIMSVAATVNVMQHVRVLSILPIHHTYECTLGYLLVIYGGGCITYCDGLRHIADNMLEYKPTFILCVPLLLESIYKKVIKTLKKTFPKIDFKNAKNIFKALPFYARPIVKNKIKKTLGGKLNTFIVGAAPMTPEVSNAFEELGIRVLQGYGLTECSPLVAGNNDFYRKADAAGLPIPNVTFKIDSPNQEGVGEIIVRGPNVMLGYYQDEEATKKALQDGWFYTGDLGKIDEEGYLHITGRSKSVIIAKNGKNIYPEELEAYLTEEPMIQEALVLGVKDEKKEDTLVEAKIFPNMDAIKKFLKLDQPSDDQVKKIIGEAVQEVNKKIPNYKHIKGFRVVKKEFEKTTTQKIKRYGENTKIEKE